MLIIVLIKVGNHFEGELKLGGNPSVPPSPLYITAGGTQLIT